MMRPRWPGQATLHQCQARSLRLYSSHRDAPPTDTEWPQLKRRTPLPRTGTALDDKKFDAALAALLRARGSSSKEREGRKGVGRPILHNSRTEIDWGALESSAKRLKQTIGADGVRQDQRRNGSSDKQKTTETKAAKTKNMLLVRGVSPNLTASDFFRLAPSSLSGWERIIKKGWFFLLCSRKIPMLIYAEL